MIVIKVAIIAITASILALNLKNIKSEFGILISIGACIIIFFYGSSYISEVIFELKKISDLININDVYIGLMFKIIGITYISEIASDISNDCGYSTLGKQIQIFGKISILCISIPVLSAVIETISELL